MEAIKKNIGFIIAVTLLLAIGIAFLWQGRTIQNLKEQANIDKEAAIIAIENRYKDSIRMSEERIKIWEAKYDSVASYKGIVKEAIKINKKKSDEKINYIFTANDSILRYISDSTLRANGFDR